MKIFLVTTTTISLLQTTDQNIRNTNNSMSIENVFFQFSPSNDNVILQGDEQEFEAVKELLRTRYLLVEVGTTTELSRFQEAYIGKLHILPWTSLQQRQDSILLGDILILLVSFSLIVTTVTLDAIRERVKRMQLVAPSVNPDSGNRPLMPINRNVTHNKAKHELDDVTFSGM